MTDSTSLANHFLIAMPQLADPNFFHSVTYICEHNDDGAMGIVINRPLEIGLAEVLDHINISGNNKAIDDQVIYMGGPVQPERGFVLHSPSGQWDSTLTIADDICITTSRDILTAIANDQGPAHYVIALGYAGWGKGQLEEEISQNAWLSGPAEQNILFDMPYEKRWEAAASLLGIDVNLISGEAGHA
ncbi:MAG: YqgE/AlgH family protein [Gammaproteobacteria bacterium]|nr:YqgE/AlgH family protein [Gammaproteobacteria bacterium]